MKKLTVLVVGILSLIGVNIPSINAEFNPLHIDQVTQETPLYLHLGNHPGWDSNSWHGSHGSHYAHRSHYAHYSGRY